VVVEAPKHEVENLKQFAATLEDPRQILAAQLNKAKGEAAAQMKAEGIEYDQRMELLDEVTYPKPLEELLGHVFEVYR
jgi:uncharacterized protein DUF3516